MIPNQKDIEVPLLEALIEIGGEGRPNNIYPLVTKRFPTITEDDLAETLKSGGNKWTNRIQWARSSLRKKGEIGTSTRGVWAITEKGRERVNEKKLPVVQPIKYTDEHIRTFSDEMSEIHNILARLDRFRARWITFEGFKRHFDKMENHFMTYEQIWITGHFSNNFARGIEGLCNKFPGCDFRILSIDPKGNRINIDALIKMEEDGAKVKIHKKLHARMFIGYHKKRDMMELMIGSYDYNREGYSGENINVCVSSRDPELIQKARKFFIRLWKSRDAGEIKNMRARS